MPLLYFNHESIEMSLTNPQSLPNSSGLKSLARAARLLTGCRLWRSRRAGIIASMSHVTLAEAGAVFCTDLSAS